MILSVTRIGRRGLMYLLVGLQMLVLATIVASHELNIALDSGLAVDVEVAQARARKDPFRGAYVSGSPALDLDGRAAALPSAPLQPGDRVIVFCTVEAGRRPRIMRVERAGGDDPPFSAAAFTIPGTVRTKESDRPFSAREGSLVARVGNPPVAIELALPASIAVDDSALGRFTGPSLVRASLHKGFLGHRFLSDVRLVGHGWTHEVSFAYDGRQARLMVLSPRDSFGVRPASADVTPRTDVFFFDGLGTDLRAVEVPGRLSGLVAHPGTGQLLALVSDQRWGAEVALARIGDDGHVVQRSMPITLDRILGFDDATEGIFTSTASPSSAQAQAHFVERMTFAGPRGPRLGPFASAPRAVVARDGQAWVIETEQHRITRLDLASGRTLREYRDLNGPTDVAVEGGSLYVIEANRSQLARISDDGRVLWRIPRFSGLAWVIPEPGTGAGWVGAATFEGRSGGVFRFEPDGSIARIAGLTKPAERVVWRPRRLGRDAVLSVRDRRLYVLDDRAIVVLGTDGTLLKRLEGFRPPTEESLRR